MAKRPTERPRSRARDGRHMTMVFAALSLLSLAACLAAPLLYFWGVVEMPAYKRLLDVSSVAYLAFATLWATRPARPDKML